ncbi:MAG: D-alanyl-D-alanine carboxypeptidase/D-alanyl-D-alanine-endopeptidase [Myxococcales bacterium]|nr:D-alanyl-D-alanine carboxypeptidase/D-alanyl-D-alanine-endopeptidase [Myxococcales bacterium]
MSRFCACLVALLLALPANADDRPGQNGTAGQEGRARATQLESLLVDVTGSWLFKKADVGLQVVDVKTGEEVFSRGANDLLNPASTMKVLTAATALNTLGPAYRFTTDIFTDADVELRPNGRLEGNLYVKGHGDPTFVIEKMWKLIRDLKLNGVERVEGNVVFDESFHGGGYKLPGWNKPRDLERGPTYFSTLSALSLNMNTAVMIVGPGNEVGSRARVILETPTKGYVEVQNDVTTGRAGSRRSIEIERVVEDGSTKFTVDGTVPLDAKRVRYRRTVGDPTQHFLAAFQHMLKDEGIRVDGRFVRGVTPFDAEMLLSVPSPPLVSVLMDMNKYSLNFQAEQVLRTLGAEVEGEGTTQGGLRVVRRYLQGLGVTDAHAVLVNGSGLSREAKLAPSALTAVLVDMARNPRVGAEFASSLAIGGVDGTLWRRLRDEPSRMRGKTGTLDGVHCLAGYLDADSGRRYAFAFLTNWSNNTRVSSVRDVHDTFARQMFKASVGGTD